MDEEQAGRAKPPRQPPVIERKPSDANAREVIAAARRGERLWLEGEEGIVQPMEATHSRVEARERANLDGWLPESGSGVGAFVSAARREEAAAWDCLEREATMQREALDEIELRVSFEPLPLPKNYSPVHEKTVTVRLNEEDEEGA
jgi:hypothetical protein